MSYDSSQGRSQDCVVCLTSLSSPSLKGSRPQTLRKLGYLARSFTTLYHLTYRELHKLSLNNQGIHSSERSIYSSEFNCVESYQFNMLNPKKNAFKVITALLMFFLNIQVSISGFIRRQKHFSILIDVWCINKLLWMSPAPCIIITAYYIIFEWRMNEPPNGSTN